MSNAGNMGQYGGYGNMDPYGQQQGQGMPPMDGGYMSPDMQNGMYNPQMGGMPNQQYADPTQQAYGGQPQGGMFYPQGQQMQPPMDRANHHAQIRTASIYGPKELHSPKIAEVERANNAPTSSVSNAVAAATGAAAGMMGGTGIAAAQAAQPAQASVAQAPAMQPQAAPAATQSFQPQVQAQPALQVQAQMQPQVQAQTPQQAAAPMQAQAAVAQAPAAQPQMQAARFAQMGMGVPPQKNGAATASLILGLLSIIFGLIPPIGIVLGIVARSVSKKYTKRGGRADRALAGKIFGLIGLIFSIAMLVAIGVCAALMFGQIAGPQVARDMLIFYNNSPLGQLGTFALPTVS